MTPRVGYISNVHKSNNGHRPPFGQCYDGRLICQRFCLRRLRGELKLSRCDHAIIFRVFVRLCQSASTTWRCRGPKADHSIGWVCKCISRWDGAYLSWKYHERCTFVLWVWVLAASRKSGRTAQVSILRQHVQPEDPTPLSKVLGRGHVKHDDGITLHSADFAKQCLSLYEELANHVRGLGW